MGKNVVKLPIYNEDGVELPHHLEIDVKFLLRISLGLGTTPHARIVYAKKQD